MGCGDRNQGQPGHGCKRKEIGTDAWNARDVSRDCALNQPPWQLVEATRGVTQISWSGVGSLTDPPAEEVEQPLLHSNAMPSCASANRDHQQSWATPRQQGQSGNSALVVAPRAGADRTDVPQERLKARGAARAPMESSNATTGHASRQPPKTHDKDQISGVSIMSIVKCPPAQRIPMSGAWYSPIQAMSAMMSVSPDT